MAETRYPHGQALAFLSFVIPEWTPPCIRARDTAMQLRPRPRRRAAPAAAAAAAKLDEVLSTDVLAHVLQHLSIHNRIRGVLRTSKAFAAAGAIARKQVDDVVHRHDHPIYAVGTTDGGTIVTAACKTLQDPNGRTIHVWRDGKRVRTIVPQPNTLNQWFAGMWRAVREEREKVSGPLTQWGERTFTDEALLPLLETLNMTTVVAMPDEKHIIASLSSTATPGGEGAQLRMYDTSGQLVHNFTHARGRRQLPYAHSADITQLGVMPNGKHILSGDFRGMLHVWSVETKALVSKQHAHGRLVRSLVPVPDNRRILSGGTVGYVRVAGLTNRTRPTFYELFPDDLDVSALLALPDCKHGLAAATDVVLFRILDGARLRSWPHHRGPVRGLAILDDGRRFASASEDRTLRIAYHGREIPLRNQRGADNARH